MTMTAIELADPPNSKADLLPVTALESVTPAKKQDFFYKEILLLRVKNLRKAI